MRHFRHLFFALTVLFGVSMNGGAEEPPTLEQCQSRVEIKKEIFKIASLRGTTNDSELLEALSPEAQSFIQEDLSRVQWSAAETDFESEHTRCRGWYPDHFEPLKGRSVLEVSPDEMAQAPPQAISPERRRPNNYPGLLNQRSYPKAFSPEVLLGNDKADGGGSRSTDAASASVRDGHN